MLTMASRPRLVEPPLPLEEALVLLAEAEEERREADVELRKVLMMLGLEVGHV
jgi:hypothetical protein